MLRDYRSWLASEFQLLGNASHHAYAFGQANMAKRALEKFDAEVAVTLAAIDRLVEAQPAAAPDLAALRAAIAAELTES